jgi:hypothetical protein
MKFKPQKSQRPGICWRCERPWSASTHPYWRTPACSTTNPSTGHRVGAVSGTATASREASSSKVREHFDAWGGTCGGPSASAVGR